MKLAFKKVYCFRPVTYETHKRTKEMLIRFITFLPGVSGFQADLSKLCSDFKELGIAMINSVTKGCGKTSP